MESVTIVIPVSRSTFLADLFYSLEALTCDKNNTGLFFYVDGDLRLLGDLKRCLQYSTFPIKQFHFRNKGVGTVGAVRRRRQRIADIHNEIKAIVPNTEFLFFIEDDTIVPADALITLMATYKSYGGIGLVSGIELGRWGFPIIGAWERKDNTITSSPFQDHGIRKVSATGLYCMLVRREYYVSHFFKPFDTILGCDVSFGFSLEDQGLANLIDYSVKCKHLQIKSDLTFDKISPIQLRFSKNGDGSWTQNVI